MGSRKLLLRQPMEALGARDWWGLVGRNALTALPLKRVPQSLGAEAEIFALDDLTTELLFASRRNVQDWHQR